VVQARGAAQMERLAEAEEEPRFLESIALPALVQSRPAPMAPRRAQDW
jgi:hypothetical protein